VPGDVTFAGRTSCLWVVSVAMLLLFCGHKVIANGGAKRPAHPLESPRKRAAGQLPPAL
jgi:hypothetical protein